MPVKSYLVYPAEGRGGELQRILAAWPECDVLPAETGELFVLVTDTPDEETEKVLERRLLALDALQCLALVAAFRDPQ